MPSFEIESYKDPSAPGYVALHTIQVWRGKQFILDASGKAKPQIGPVPDLDREGTCVSFFSGRHPETGKPVTMRPMSELAHHGTVEESVDAKISFPQLERLMKARHHSMRGDFARMDPQALVNKIEADRLQCLKANGFNESGAPVTVEAPSDKRVAR